MIVDFVGRSGAGHFLVKGVLQQPSIVVFVPIFYPNVSAYATTYDKYDDALLSAPQLVYCTL
jgi:hypothetical protein